MSNTFLPITTSIKDLTTKLQTTNIISAIPPILENVNSVNVHTDENIIMNAEEAKEASPPRLQTTDAYFQKKFDDIGKREFNDKILFKKSKGQRKKSGMETSGTSLSSNSSEDKDLSYTRPTIMNLSTVGILPDLRSPQSINYDIEYKEKILADVLNLDKVKIRPNQPTDAAEEDVNSIRNKIENDCDYSPIILQNRDSLDSVDIKEMDKSAGIEQNKSKNASPESRALMNGSKGLINCGISPPGMLDLKKLYL